MKTALVGLGRMGMRHAQVLRESGLQIAACADQRQKAIDELAGKYSIPDSGRFTDAIIMIESTKPELLVIATTAPSHRELVEAAAKNGARAILCEKPMATSLNDCVAMMKACEVAGIRLAVNHQMRFMEQYTVPKYLVNSDKFGGLGSVLVSAGNFGMAMNGTHYFEMFRFISAEVPVKVNAWFDSGALPNPRGEQFRDTSGSIRLETANGKRFFLDCSADQGHGMFLTYNCRHGRIEIDELAGSMNLIYRDDEHRDAPTTRYGMPYKVERVDIKPADATAPTKAVLEALLSNSNFPNGYDGMVAMQVLIAAHLSHQRGGATVDLRNEELDYSLVLPIA
jgi:predicted dehydrogenase